MYKNRICTQILSDEKIKSIIFTAYIYFWLKIGQTTIGFNKSENIRIFLKKTIEK